MYTKRVAEASKVGRTLDDSFCVKKGVSLVKRKKGQLGYKKDGDWQVTLGTTAESQHTSLKGECMCT